MKKLIIPLSIILSNFLIGILLYTKFPLRMATHWGISGQADGYSSKLFGTFLLPLISFFLFLLLNILPSLDPNRENFKSFEKHYRRFIFSFLLFQTYLYFLVILWNLNFRFNMIQALTPAFSFLFFMCGQLITVAKRNWFVGVRTPWTLSSDYVWEKTHRITGRLFRFSSLMILAGLFLPQYSLLFILLPITAVSIFSVVYSCYLYLKTKKFQNEV